GGGRRGAHPPRGRGRAAAAGRADPHSFERVARGQAMAKAAMAPSAGAISAVEPDSARDPAISPEISSAISARRRPVARGREDITPATEASISASTPVLFSTEDPSGWETIWATDSPDVTATIRNAASAPPLPLTAAVRERRWSRSSGEISSAY